MDTIDWSSYPKKIPPGLLKEAVEAETNISTVLLVVFCGDFLL